MYAAAVRATLTPQGSVIGNVWGRSVNRLYDSMVKTYRSVYDGLMVVDVVASGNKILIATADRRELPQYVLMERAERISRKLGLRHDFSEVAARSLRLPGEDGVAGELLTDAEVGAAVAR